MSLENRRLLWNVEITVRLAEKNHDRMIHVLLWGAMMTVDILIRRTLTCLPTVEIAVLLSWTEDFYAARWRAGALKKFNHILWIPKHRKHFTVNFAVKHMAENTFWGRHIKKLHELLGEVLSNRNYGHGIINQLSGKVCSIIFIKSVDRSRDSLT